MPLRKWEERIDPAEDHSMAETYPPRSELNTERKRPGSLSAPDSNSATFGVRLMHGVSRQRENRSVRRAVQDPRAANRLILVPEIALTL